MKIVGANVTHHFGAGPAQAGGSGCCFLHKWDRTENGSKHEGDNSTDQ